MRVIRSFLILLVATLAAAGCALAPAAQAPETTGSIHAAPRTDAAGIDATVYGSAGSAAAKAPRLAASSRAAAPLPDGGRGLLVAAAATSAAVQPAPAAAPAAAPPVSEAHYTSQDRYTLDSGDRLRIVVYGQSGLSNSYLVDASGYIAMPLIGSVPARGETTDQLSRRIAVRLRQGYVRDPHVAVEIEAYRPFFILGEVAQPGQYPYVADMTVETAVAIAGGFKPRAYRKTVTITRMADGREVRLKAPAGYPVHPGDTINVQERWF